MKIVVVGGTGLIGLRVVDLLNRLGHDVSTASPSTGVSTITREGLAEVLNRAEVVIDVTNAPSKSRLSATEFFQISSRNLLAAAAASGVSHFVALSIVASERNPDNVYLRAKLAQEAVIKASDVPYTILRSTQFFESIEGIIESSISGTEIRLSPALIQPIAADEVASMLVEIAECPARRATLEIAGPEAIPLDEAARRLLHARHDSRVVVADVHARYFGAELDDRSLTPSRSTHLGMRRFDDWLSSDEGTPRRLLEMQTL